jgi:hypothetical protein
VGLPQKYYTEPVGLPQGVDFQEKSRLIRCGVFGEGESCIAESMCLRAPLRSPAKARAKVEQNGLYAGFFNHRRRQFSIALMNSG